jgi:8-oxo-dGTP pyrophosphatase MutT (NUDIX family)
MSNIYFATDNAIRQLVPVSVDLHIESPESIVESMLKLETAHWYYVDHVQPNQHPELPRLRFKQFIRVYIPWLKGQQLFNAMKLFNRYKKTLPIFGSIILNPERTRILLVQNVNSESWSFPKGKQELNESEICSVTRETLEETNFFVADKIDLRKKLRHRKATFIIIENVAEYTFFVPWKRTEICNVAWHNVADLSEDNPIYNIYIRHIQEKLKNWIDQRHLSPEVLPVINESDDDPEEEEEDDEHE